MYVYNQECDLAWHEWSEKHGGLLNTMSRLPAKIAFAAGWNAKPTSPESHHKD